MPVKAPDCYQFPKTAGCPNKPPSDSTEKHNHLISAGLPAFGIDNAQLKSLQHYRINILCGEIGNVFATTSTHTIHRFQSADYPDKGLLFKSAPPFYSEISNKTYIQDSNVAASTAVHDNTAVRNILCQLFARELGIESLLPEYSLGIANNQSGTVMTEIKGKTVHQWLIDEGYLDQVALRRGVNKIQLEQLACLKRPYQSREFLQLMHTAFTEAVNKKGLSNNWRAISFLDYLTGQSDRSNLKNIIITSDGNGHQKLMAIDNDMTFPVRNAPLMIRHPPTPHSSYSDEQVKQLHTNLLTITSCILPKALPALKERLNNFIRCWHWDTPPADNDPINKPNKTNVRPLELLYPLPSLTLPLHIRLCRSITHALRKLMPCSRVSHGVSSESL